MIMSGAETTRHTAMDQQRAISATATMRFSAGTIADMDNDHAGILEDGQVLLFSAGCAVGNQHQRKRVCPNFPWTYTREWAASDPIGALGNKSVDTSARSGSLWP